MQGVEVEIVGGIIGGLVVVLAAASWRWWYPRLRQWFKNRAYDISFTKSVPIGENNFTSKLMMNSSKNISEIRFTFVKAKSSGHAGGDIVSFKKLEVIPKINLPYQSSVDAHGCHATIYFTPFRALNKRDRINFEMTIDAKIQWQGRLAFEVREENGSEILIHRVFKIVASKQPTPDTEGSQTK